MPVSKILSLCAEGPLALFTVPATKVEKHTYDVMTVTAGRGIIQSVFWKPEVEIEIVRIDVCNPIRRSTSTFNYVSKKGTWPTKRHLEDPSLLIQNVASPALRQQVRHTMLRDVRYVIHFRYYLTEHAGSTETPQKGGDMCEKFVAMFEKYLRRGAYFRLPCFGMQNLVAYCRPVTPQDVPIDETRELGMMPHYRIYGEDSVETLWFSARLERGVVHVPSRIERERARARGEDFVEPTHPQSDRLERKQKSERQELERKHARERLERKQKAERAQLERKQARELAAIEAKRRSKPRKKRRSRKGQKV